MQYGHLLKGDQVETGLQQLWLLLVLALLQLGNSLFSLFSSG